MKRLVFIGRKNGLCNRLEMLMAAYVIRRQFRHLIVTDWPEAEFMELPMVQPGRPEWWRRLVGYRVVDSATSLAELGGAMTIDIRAISPLPDATVQREIAAMGPRIRPAGSLAQTMMAKLESLQGKPVVGVHVRQGDFVLVKGDAYSAHVGRHTSVPIWWYQWMMARIVERIPDVTFLLCVSGSVTSVLPLLDEYNCILSDFEFGFELPRPGHQAQSNPVADLFALAACSVIVGTPASSFTHWAASNLGGRSIVISPPLAMTADEPGFRVSSFRGTALYEWVHFSWSDDTHEVHSTWGGNRAVAGFDCSWWNSGADASP